MCFGVMLDQQVSAKRAVGGVNAGGHCNSEHRSECVTGRWCLSPHKLYERVECPRPCCLGCFLRWHNLRANPHCHRECNNLMLTCCCSATLAAASSSLVRAVSAWSSSLWRCAMS